MEIIGSLVKLMTIILLAASVIPARAQQTPTTFAQAANPAIIDPNQQYLRSWKYSYPGKSTTFTIKKVGPDGVVELDYAYEGRPLQATGRLSNGHLKIEAGQSVWELDYRDGWWAGTLLGRSGKLTQVQVLPN